MILSRQFSERLRALNAQYLAAYYAGNAREAARLRLEIETLARALQASAISERAN